MVEIKTNTSYFYIVNNFKNIVKILRTMIYKKKLLIKQLMRHK